MIRKNAVFLLGMIFVAAGCRLIAGYEDVTLGPSDATADSPSASDGGGCLVAAPTRLFSTPNSLDEIFVANGTLYAVYDDSTSGNTAMLGCDPASCATPKIVVTPTDSFLYEAPGSPILFTIGGDDSLDTDDAGNPLPANDGQILAYSDAGLKPITTTLRYPFATATNGSDLYFTDDPSSDSNDSEVDVSTLRKCAIAGCPSPEAWMTGFYSTYQVALGATKVFVTADTDESQTAIGLFSCSLTTPCGANPAKTIAGDDFQGAFATSGDTVFAAATNTNSIVRVDTDGGVAPFASDQNSPSAIIVDDTYVYWLALTDSTNLIGDVRRKRLDGSGTIDRVLCGFSVTTGFPYLTADAAHLYVVTTDANSNYIVESVQKPQ